MMVKLLFLFTFFFIVSCSQKGGAPATKIVVKNNFSLGSTFPGGMMLYLHHAETGKVKSIKIQDLVYDTVLENGNWTISVVAWQGTAPLTGNLICGTTSALIKGQETSINLSINSTQCDTSSFSPDTYRTTGLTNTVQFINCNTFDNVSGAGSNCDNADKGISGSYKIHVLEYTNTPPTELPATFTALSSNCIAAATSANSKTNTSIKIPLGFGIEKFTTVVESFTDSSCVSSKQSYFFQDGLVSGENDSSDIKSFPSAGMADIYLLRGGMSITGINSIGPVNKNSPTDATFTIQNKSISSLILTSVTLSGSTMVGFKGGTFPGTDGTCVANSSLASQATCDVVLTFNPTSSGLYQPSISAMYSDGTSSFTSTFGFQAYTPAEMALTTGSANLGTFAQDSTPNAISLTFTNIGGMNADLTMVSGLTNYILTSNTCGSGSLAPGATCSVAISLDTANITNFTENLTLNYDDGANSQILSLPVTASVVAPALIEYYSGTTNFGLVGTNSSPTPQNQIMFKNNGGYTATLSGIFVDSPFYAGTDTCSFGFLLPGQTCYIDVYLGTANNFNNDPTKYVSVSYHDGTSNTAGSIALQGYVNSLPNLSISGSVNLGSFPLNGSVTPSELTVTNTGGTSATITSITNITTFSIVPGSDNCTNTTLGQNDTCTFSVTLPNNTAGFYQETLNLNYTNIASSSSNVSTVLSATINTATHLTLTKIASPYVGNYHNYGWSYQNTNSDPVQYQIFNDGSSIATIDSYTGLFGTNFSITSTDCGSTLNVGASCSLYLVFNPTDSNPQSTFFKVNYSDSFETAQVLLEGRGKPIVEPFYSTAPNWNDYFDHDPSIDRFSDYDTACNPVSSSDCLHGGELRKITLTDFNSGTCDNLNFNDNLNAFNWECVPNNSGVTIRSTGFAPGKGLKDLLDPTAFKTMKLQVFQAGSPVFETPEGVWWNNSVIQLSGDIETEDYGTPLPLANSNNGYDGFSELGTNHTGYLNTWVLNSEGAIYTVDSSLAIPSIYFGANKISLVTLDGASISSTNDGSYDTCNLNTGEILWPDFKAIICVSNGNSNFHSDFHWIEVNVTANDAPIDPLFMNGTRYNRVHNSILEHGYSGLFLNNSSKKNLFTNLQTKYNSYFGIEEYETSNQVFQGIVSSQNGINGLSSYSPNNNTYISSRFVFNGISGISFDQSGSNKLHDLIVSNNLNSGIYLQNGTNNILSQITSVNNSDAGINLYNEFNSVILNATTNNNLVSGLRLDRSSGIKVVNVVTSNNGSGAGGYGVQIMSSDPYDPSTDNLFKHFVAANNDYNISINQHGSFNEFYSFFVGPFENGNIDNSGTGNTVNQGTPLMNLDSTYIGRAMSDGTNPAILDVNGLTNLISISNFTDFDNFFRAWGQHSSAAESPIASDALGPCTSMGDCSIFDWRIQQNDSAILNRSYNGSENTDSFTPAQTCPTQVDGDNYSSSATTTFLNLAIEEVDLYDGIGNDNGLCESYEKCIYSPNFGSFQGEGGLQSECTFVNGTVTDVTMRAYTQYHGN